MFCLQYLQTFDQKNVWRRRFLDLLLELVSLISYR